MNRTQIRQALFGLAALGNVAAALPADGEASRRAATDRYNAAVIARAASLKGGAILASPVLGAGVPAGFIDLLLLTEAWNEDGAVDRVMATISRHGHSIRKDGKVLDTDTAIREQVETRARSFFAELLPFFRMMGVAA